MNIVKSTFAALLAAIMLAGCSDHGSVDVSNGGADDGAGAPARMARLGHEGRWLTDPSGRVVILHGINQIDKLPPYLPSNYQFTQKAMDYLADLGFNAVRLGIIYKAIEPKPGKYDEQYLDKIQAIVEQLADAGFYVLLDLHQDMFNERYNGEGFPDWAAIDGGLPAKLDRGFPQNYFIMPALSRAYDNFWKNARAPDGVGLQEHYANAWAHIAERFTGNSAVFGFDLGNELWPGSIWQNCAQATGCPMFDTHTLTPFWRKVIDAIRTSDPRTLTFYEAETLHSQGAATHIGDVGDANAGFSFHHYCKGTLGSSSNSPAPVDNTGQRDCNRVTQYVFNDAEQQAEKFGDALVLSEYGATNDLEELERVIEAAESRRLPWMYWAWWGHEHSNPEPTQGIIIDPDAPPAPDNLRQKKLDVLVRPYPMAVAGTPEKWNYDPSENTFTLRYSTTAVGKTLEPDAVTRVFVPERHYPDGYTLEVEGARAVSKPDTPILRLANEPDAKEVKLRITARQ